MKKTVLILSIVLLSISCKRGEELDIDTSINDEEQVKKTVTADETQSKPLIVVDKNDEVKILVRSDGFPGMYLGDDNEVHGFYVDLEKLVMEEMGQKYSFIPYEDVGSAAQALKTGTSHVALAVPDIPDYRNFLNLSEVYETLNYITFVHNDNEDIKGSTKEEILKALHGKKVGVQTTGQAFQNLRNIKEIELVEFATTTKAMEALNNGLVDAVPENRETAEYYIRKNSWNLKPVGENILNHHNTTGFAKVIDLTLVDRYNRALEKLLNNGEIYKLHQEYYGDKAYEYQR